MSKLFRYNDLRFYVRALFELKGIDVRYMAAGYDDFIQADLEVIEQVLDDEDRQNAEHMETHWLYIDRAREAIGMRESTGYSRNADSNSSWKSEMDDARKSKHAYIGLARTNSERSKDFLNNIPLGFEMHNNNPADGPIIQGVNRYRDEILNRNNWDAQRTKFIADGHDFGSGIMYNPYKPGKAGRSDRFFMEERARQGQPIPWSEYQLVKDLATSHEMRHIDTFDVLRDRRACGEDSMDFGHRMHTITTWMDSMTVTEAMQLYPDHASRIKNNYSDLHQRVNPKAVYLSNDDLIVTKKVTWVQCPVQYELDVPVDVGNNIIVNEKKVVNRVVVLEFHRLEGIGIVDIEVDKYAHGEIPLTMWQRRPSKVHAYGIGAFKDMWAAEWAYNIAFNGKFQWFNRMAKGGGFYYKGAVGRPQLEQRAREHTWVEIDPSTLPPEFRNQPISNLVYDTRPTAFPSVYDNLEMSMEDKVNRTSGWHDVAGKPSGTSGRQQQILENAAQSGMGPTVKNLEMAFKPMGDKFFSNIVQFDGDHPIAFTYEDPVTQEPGQVELNIPQGMVDEFDEETGHFKMYAYHVKNSIKTLEWNTQVSTRSIVPTNPTEQRFFWLDTLNSIFPFTQNEQGLAFLDVLDKRVYGGLFDDMIRQLQEVFERQAMLQQQQIEAQQQAEMERNAQDRELEMVDKAQNKFRLEQKAVSDLLSALSKFKNGDPQALQQFTNNNPNLNLNQLL